jgi:hypothetical protein
MSLPVPRHPAKTGKKKEKKGGKKINQSKKC